MGPDLRERESGDTERGAAPAPATRGAGTERPTIRSFRRRWSAGARHGGTRGNDHKGVQRGGRGERGKGGSTRRRRIEVARGGRGHSGPAPSCALGVMRVSGR